MASKQDITYADFQIGVRPQFWLRNFLTFLPFFESTNPSFGVHVRRVGATRSYADDQQLTFVVTYPDETEDSFSFPVPTYLPVGQEMTYLIPSLLCPKPGRMTIKHPKASPPNSFFPLYSYTVHPEERIWVPIFALAFTSLGVVLQRYLIP